MNWVIYFLFFISVMVIPATILGMVKERAKESDFLSRDNTMVYKGVAITSVILCHFMGTFGSGNVTLFTPLGGIGVAIFLILSGFGLNESWNKLENNDSGGDNTAVGGENASYRSGHHMS